MSKRKTNDEFLQEVFSLVRNEYSVLSPYINNKTKVLMRHNCKECKNYEWEVNPKAFLRLNSRCPWCAKAKIRKTHEEFVQEIEDKYHGEYSVLGKYINANTKILMRHNVCSHKWDVLAQQILDSSCCPMCAPNRRKTQVEFENDVFSIVGEEYKVLGEYINNSTKIKMRHNICSHEYEVRPADFIHKKYKCPKCFSISKETQEPFNNKVKTLIESEYSVLGKYINSKTKVLMRHNCSKCNNFEYMVRPADFLRGNRCPKCFGTPKKTQKQFENEVKALVGDEYIVQGEYKTSRTKILMKHCKCGTIFNVIPSEFLYQESRCTYCRESKGERKIEKYLLSKNINYQRQYRIPECRGKRPYPFDFAIFDKENNLKFLIEYQGRQHYEMVKAFHMNEEDFVDRVLTDCNKQAYCEYENIPLLTISYKDYKNIEDIVKNKLFELNLMKGDE